jgi:hypothetical protein
VNLDTLLNLAALAFMIILIVYFGLAALDTLSHLMGGGSGEIKRRGRSGYRPIVRYPPLLCLSRTHRPGG